MFRTNLRERLESGTATSVELRLLTSLVTAPKRDTEEDAKRHRLLKENLTAPEMRAPNMLLRKAEGQEPAECRAAEMKRPAPKMGRPLRHD
jgi:hypothetical protein